jgi:hypothetical protein
MIPPTRANAPPRPATRVCAAPAELEDVLRAPDDEAPPPEDDAVPPEVPAAEVTVDVLPVTVVPAVGLPLVESCVPFVVVDVMVTLVLLLDAVITLVEVTLVEGSLGEEVGNLTEAVEFDPDILAR